MDEDDVVVIVVEKSGDEDSETDEYYPLKTEPVSMDEADVSEIIEAAKKHGQCLPVTVKKEDITDDETEDTDVFKFLEASESDSKHLNIEFQCNTNAEKMCPKQEFDNDDEGAYFIKEEYIENYVDDPGDEDYVPDVKEEYQSDSEEEIEPKRRRAPLSPAHHKSFVQDLKQEYPELRRDKKALVKSLVEIMRNIKRPPPPQDFFIMTETMFECRKCGAMTETREAACRHQQEKHGPRYLVCFACGVDFRSTTNLYKHEKHCIAPDINTVLKARALFLGRKGRSRPFIPKPEDLQALDLLDSIKKRKTTVSRFTCSDCPASFTSKISLEAHENLHKGLRPYRCHQCINAYTSIARLKRHMKQQHSGIKFICDHCGREFKDRAALVVHLNTHMPMPKFGCEECTRRYATKAALNHHVRRAHRNLPPPCACPICPKSFPRMSIVRDHMKKVHGMSLMTRKMFVKALPKLTDEQLQQAKVILKSEKPLYNT